MPNESGRNMKYTEHKMSDPVTHRRSLGFMYNYLIDVKLKVLKRFIDIDDTIIDVGAGFGQYAERLYNLGYKVVALEPDERYIRSQHIVPYEICKAEDITGRYDIVYMFNVLHHADDPILAVRRVVQSSRRVVISEINRKNIFVSFYVNNIMKHEDIESHLSEADVREIIIGAGAKIKRHFTTGVFGIPFVYNWFIIE